MKFSLSLLDTNTDVRNNILQAMSKHMDKALVKTINNIEPKIRILLRNAMQLEPEYASLISGTLRREFGIEDVSSIDSVVDRVVNSMKLSKQNINITNNGLNGGITLTIVPKDLSGIIDDPSAFVVDSDRGYSLPWLEWLLLKGGSIIVRNYNVQYGPNARSRSGDAIMVSSNKNWRVPQQFSGTITNNWITRALSTIEEKILTTIQKGLEDSV